MIEIADWAAVDDFGKIINPMIVEGQVHGGIAQGVGQAMLENCVYDADGQLLTGSYMDYCMPRADNLPSIQDRDHRDALSAQPAGGEGLWRGRRDRSPGRRDQRGDRRPRRGHRHAGHAGEGLARSPQTAQAAE